MQRKMLTAALALIALTSTAHATVIHLHGTITAVEGAPPDMAQVGDSFTGRLFFNPNRPFNHHGDPNVSFVVQITTLLGTFSYSIEPTYSFYSGIFPGIIGQTLEQEIVGIDFTTANLDSFISFVSYWDGGCAGCDPLLGLVTASGTATVTVPETASTFGLLLLAVVGIAMLRSYSTAFRKT